MTKYEHQIIKEFFEGKSLETLVSEHLNTHDVTKKEAIQYIYNLLCTNCSF